METADAMVSVPEMSNCWIGAGRVHVAFLGAAQIDRHANLGPTVVGDYDRPRTRRTPSAPRSWNCSSVAEAFLHDAVRTPFSRCGGALAGVRPDDLVGQGLVEVLRA